MIIKQELSAEEAAFVYGELSRPGVTLTESGERHELLDLPLSGASEVRWEFNWGRKDRPTVVERSKRLK